MAFLTTLDVVNAQLATLGETPLNSIEEDHPFVAAGLLSLRTINNREQAKGWWFNKELVTLNPDVVTGVIAIPDDAISVDPIGPHLVVRGRKMFDPYNSTYTFTAPIRARLTRRLEFEDLPSSAANWIALSAVYDFGNSYDADQQKLNRIRLERQDALITLNSEHIRNYDINFLDRADTAFSLYKLGRTPQLGTIRH